MKLVLFLTLTLMLTAPAALSAPRIQAPEGRQNLLEQPIEAELDVRNIVMLMSSLSTQTKIPIGLELSPFDNLSVAQGARLRVNNQTLSEVLNVIVKKNPLYTWKIENGVVNVFPVPDKRDNLLKQLLETKLEKFEIAQRATRYMLRAAIIEATPVKSLLEKQKLLPDYESFQSRDFDPIGSNIALSFSNASVSEVLNRVAKDTLTRYWVLSRHQKNKRYVVLSI